MNMKLVGIVTLLAVNIGLFASDQALAQKIAQKSKENRKVTRSNQLKKHRLNVIFHSSRWNAKKRKLEHTISIEYLEKLWNDQQGLCYYTNQKMLKDLRNTDNNNDSISLDRIDSSKGYIEGNVVLCRWIINRMKNDIPHDTFLNIVSEINKNFNRDVNR